MLFLDTVVFLLIFTEPIKAMMSNTCWDGTLAIDYTGTISTTKTGRTCQNWKNDTPHSHSYHDIDMFPYDGGDVKAENYCRDPDGDSGSDGTWCYTMDPSKRYEYCDIPICTNLPCGGGEVIGQSDPATLNSNINSRVGKNFLMKDVAPYAFTCCGTIKEWRFYIGNPGTIRLQAWRLDAGSGNYSLLGQNVYSYSSGEINTSHTETVTQNVRISVQEGDLIGWNTVDIEMITYNTGTTDQNALIDMSTAPSIGDSIDFSSATIRNNRDYAIGAVVAESLSPYFVNTVTATTISVTESVGNSIFALSVTDDDTDDVSSLVVTMDQSAFFELSGTGAYISVAALVTNYVTVKAALTVGTYVLNFLVTDLCSKQGVFSLTVTVAPEAIVISSLPTTANVSESATNETLIHSLTFSPTGNYTCVIDSYNPTRAEGNPFLIQNTPSSDIGVYLKNAANIRYNVATSYNVTVTCTDAATSSDTDYIIITVDPNTSLTIYAGSTSANDIVYNATVFDAEGDPISMTLTCDPSPCPFIINNIGEIMISVDPRLENHTTYIFIMTADDGFNTVTSSNVSVVLSGVNVAPFFTNLPTSAQFVMENQSSGTYVFQVSQSDANGDVTTFSVVSYSHATCASKYSLNTANGSITTLDELNYESDPNCTLTITVSDGLYTSDPENLIIYIVDIDEAPVMFSNGYIINTDEVVDGTALPDVSIGASDPEGTAVSLSLNCGTDSGYLTIDPTSGIVTMAIAYDLETSTTNTYTITCVVNAADATGQASTASLDVTVSDTNDNTPVFSLPAYSYFLSLGYSGLGIIGKVTARDADVTSPNNAITYSITPMTSFDIGASGAIYNKVDLSGDAVGTTYALVVTATDGGTPPTSATADVVITILSSTTTTTTTTVATETTTYGFFSDPGNILSLVLAIFVAAVMAALIAYLICRKSGVKPVEVEKEKIQKDGVKEDKIYDEYKRKEFHKTSSGIPVVNLGQPVPYQLPEVEPKHPSPHMKSRTPVDTGYERPSSTESGIYVTPAQNSPVLRNSALESVKRSHWLTDIASSPRSPAKIDLDWVSRPHK